MFAIGHTTLVDQKLVKMKIAEICLKIIGLILVSLLIHIGTSPMALETRYVHDLGPPRRRTHFSTSIANSYLMGLHPGGDH